MNIYSTSPKRDHRQQVNTNLVVVKTNTDLGVDSQFIKEKEVKQPVEPIIIINEAGIHQPLKPIGKMLQELDFKNIKAEKEMIIFGSQI